MCQIGSDNICTRTDRIAERQIQESMDNEIARVKNELITYCPAYTEGL